MRMRIHGVCDVEAGGVVIFDSRNAGFDDMAGFPELGAFIHVLVEPLVADGKMKLLDEKSELRVEGSEKRENRLEELD